jgi:hydroxymethylpyrimidine pyrophosphatase-like HAD family hydrolase
VLEALKLLGLGPGDCLAMGDGENDLEMLQVCACERGRYIVC